MTTTKKTELTPEEKFLAEAQRAGERAAASIKDDLDALRHAQTCHRTNCKTGRETKTITVGGKKIRQMKHNDPEAWHDEGKADSAIRDSHYGIALRSGWYTIGEEEPTPEEYTITLGGGGPASRIHGELSNGEPTTAFFEYQDWFKPWTKVQLTSEQQDTLLEYARFFYYGE